MVAPEFSGEESPSSESNVAANSRPSKDEDLEPQRRVSRFWREGETRQSLRGARPNRFRSRTALSYRKNIGIGMGRLHEVVSNDDPR